MKKGQFEIKTIVPDTKLVRIIGRKRPHIKKGDITEMLKYNVLTSNQLASLTGKRPDSISTMSNTLRIRGGEVCSKLTRVYLFPHTNEAGELIESNKQSFILVDDKCLKFLLDNNR